MKKDHKYGNSVKNLLWELKMPFISIKLQSVRQFKISGASMYLNCFLKGI